MLKYSDYFEMAHGGLKAKKIKQSSDITMGAVIDVMRAHGMETKTALDLVDKVWFAVLSDQLSEEVKEK